MKFNFESIFHILIALIETNLFAKYNFIYANDVDSLEVFHIHGIKMFF